MCVRVYIIALLQQRVGFLRRVVGQVLPRVDVQHRREDDHGIREEQGRFEREVDEERTPFDGGGNRGGNGEELEEEEGVGFQEGLGRGSLQRFRSGEDGDGVFVSVFFGTDT